MSQDSAYAPTPIARGVAHARNLTHHDPIRIGVDTREGMDRNWSYPSVSNFNIVFLGGSGSGKTFTIHNMGAQVFVRGTTLHIIDVKGDFGYQNFSKSGVGHLLNESDFNDITFNYFDNGSSLNPLQVPRAMQGGGVVRTIEYAKELVKVFNPNAGPNQLSYLTEILKSVYKKAGLEHEDHKTWELPSPTFNDVLTEIDLVFSAISGGMDAQSASDILNLFGSARKQCNRLIRSVVVDQAEEDEVIDKIETVRYDLIKKLSSHANRLITYDAPSNDNGDCYWDHWSKQILFSLKTIIQGMVDSRLFTGNPARPQRGKINRYDVTAISSKHQQVIMRIIANQVFSMGVMETQLNNSYNPAYPGHLLIADEGKHLKEISASPLSPLNRIGTEGRGFGVGAWCGVQLPNQVTEDLLKNFTTFFLLHTTEASYTETGKLFGVKPSALKALKPRENVLFNAGGSGYTLVTHFR